MLVKSLLSTRDGRDTVQLYRGHIYNRSATKISSFLALECDLKLGCLFNIKPKPAKIRRTMCFSIEKMVCM